MVDDVDVVVVDVKIEETVLFLSKLQSEDAQLIDNKHSMIS